MIANAEKKKVINCGEEESNLVFADESEGAKRIRESESESYARKLFGSGEFEQLERVRLSLVNSPAVSKTVSFWNAKIEIGERKRERK